MASVIVVIQRLYCSLGQRCWRNRCQLDPTSCRLCLVAGLNHIKQPHRHIRIQHISTRIFETGSMFKPVAIWESDKWTASWYRERMRPRGPVISVETRHLCHCWNVMEPVWYSMLMGVEWRWQMEEVGQLVNYGQHSMDVFWQPPSSLRLTDAPGNWLLQDMARCKKHIDEICKWVNHK